MQLERGRVTQVKGMSRGNMRGKTLISFGNGNKAGLLRLMKKRCGEKSGWGGAEENR